MAEANNHLCPECGQPLLGEASDGLCPRCLLGTLLSPSCDSSAEALADVLPSEGLPKFGDYELIEEIGRGGMGVVYKARQKSLNRIVALKMMLGGPFASDQARARFWVEAEATAHLQHPNIVAIHEVGERDGLPFLTMDFVQGQSLEELAREQPLPSRAAAVYIRELAGAIAYAHAKGILHRDLKPSNVLIDGMDQARITDFGLAKRLSEEAPGLTLSGQALGSPNFMPPEQAAGEHQRIGPASDIYGLGATLYYLITGRPPFVGETVTATTRLVMETETVAPRLLNPKVPRDLETICLKCLEKDPARRYRSARELVEELDRFIRDEPILARPPGRLEKGWRWCRRQPALAGALGGIALLAVAASAVAVRLAVVGVRQEREFYYANIAQAQSMIEQGNIPRAREILLSCPDKRRHWEWGYLMAQCHQEILSFEAHTNVVAGRESFGDWVPLVRQQEFDALGRRLGTVGAAGDAKVWDIESGKLLWQDGSPKEPVQKVWFHPREARVALLESNRLTVRNVDTGELLEEPLELRGKLLAFAWGTDAELRLVLEQDNEWRLWFKKAGQPPQRLPARLPRMDSIRFSSDGERLVAMQVNIGSVLAWPDAQCVIRFAPQSAVSGTLVIDGPGARAVVEDLGGVLQILETNGMMRSSGLSRAADLSWEGSIYLSPNGRWLCTSGPEGVSKLVDLDTGQTAIAFPYRVNAVGFSTDGDRMVVMNSTLEATLYHLPSRRVLRILRGHEALVQQATFNRDGSLVATADTRGTVKIWSARMGRELFNVGGWIHACGYSPRGDKFTVAPYGGPLQVYDTDGGRRLLQLHRERLSTCDAAFSPDDSQLAVSYVNGDIWFWDLASAQPSLRLENQKRGSWLLHYTPDGRYLLAASVDRFLSIWDTQTGVLHRRLQGHPPPGMLLSDLSRDGHYAASFSWEEPQATLWEIPSGRRVGSISHGGKIQGLRFLPDGRHVATTGLDDTVRITDVRSGRLEQLWKMRGAIAPMCFSPDGKRLAGWATKMPGANWDIPSLGVWDVETGRQVLRLQGHQRYGSGLDFHPTGRRILSGSFDGTVRQWEAFPWRDAEYPSLRPGEPLMDRILRFARSYWKDRLTTEWGNNQKTGQADRLVFLPFDRSRIPPRDPLASRQMLDLTAHYTGTLDGEDLDPYLMDLINCDLAELPQGIVRLGDRTFDIRGVIRLREFAPPPSAVNVCQQDYPEVTEPIVVNQRVHRLYWLGSSLGSPTLGTLLGRLLWNYSDGSLAKSDIIFGRHLGTYIQDGQKSKEISAGHLAWTGSNSAARDRGYSIQLFETTFTNPHPEQDVASLQIESGLGAGVPVIVALTVE